MSTFEEASPEHWIYVSGRLVSCLAKLDRNYGLFDLLADELDAYPLTIAMLAQFGEDAEIVAEQMGEWFTQTAARLRNALRCE